MDKNRGGRGDTGSKAESLVAKGFLVAAISFRLSSMLQRLSIMSLTTVCQWPILRLGVSRSSSPSNGVVQQCYWVTRD